MRGLVATVGAVCNDRRVGHLSPADPDSLPAEPGSLHVSGTHRATSPAQAGDVAVAEPAAAVTPTGQDAATDRVGGGMLQATDRCDRCGARACLLAKVATGELMFCAHHAREFRDGLLAAATYIVDETALAPAGPRHGAVT